MELRSSSPFGRARAGAVAGVAALALLAPVVARAELVLPRLSPKASVTQQIGITDLSITYSRPGVKDRKIWGDLVPWGKPWRAGANEPTTFTTTDEVTVGGKALAAGSYAVLAIPAESGPWTMILSRQKDLMGSSNYDEKQDALRLTVEPAADEHQEWLQYAFEDMTPTSANLTLRWEKRRVVLPIAVDVANLTLTKGKAELAAAKADDWRTPYRLAQYTWDFNVAQDDGEKWLDQSITIKPGYSNLSLKARWLAKKGDTKGAVEAARQALEINKKSATPADASALEANLAEWSGK